MRPDHVEDLLRELAPQVLGALARRYGHFAEAEDAVQEAMLSACTSWPREGLPERPRAWLITVASRRLTDLLRAEEARQRREDGAARAWRPPAGDTEADDTLVLFYLCCHPALRPADQIALTLRSVGGLSTAEIARAFLVPEQTMAQRILRAKRRIRNHGEPFRMPAATERAERTAAVLHVLYLIFTEGYTSTVGAQLYRVDLSAEAIRLARILRLLLPRDSEVTGLLALMLLTDARRPARTGAHGELIPLAEQDRGRWDTAAISEGLALITEALPNGPAGPYQLQAAIAALHDEAPSSADTDWPQILALYEVLLAHADNPVVALNHAVALAMARGPEAGLERLARLAGDPRIGERHRYHAVRAHLLELTGERKGAAEAYLRAARLATNLREQQYLNRKAAALCARPTLTTMIGTVDTARGLLLGLLAGDCFGAPFEGGATVGEAAVRALERTGEPLRYTDDTALAFAFAAHLAEHGEVRIDRLAREFADTWRAEPWRGYGAGAARLFARVAEGTPWEQAAREQFGGSGSYGNGAAMRVAPAALAARDLGHAAELARRSALPSHAHEDGTLGAVCQAGAAFLAAHQDPGIRLDTAGFLGALSDTLGSARWRDSLERAGTLLRAGASPERAARELGNGVAAPESVPSAVYAFLREPDDLAACLRFAVRMAGDTDTIAAMAGALTGARCGPATLPASWRARLEGAERAVALADRLAVTSTGGAR